jgi:bacillithiol biosynthesis cysteine-adding enzyme BshC
LFTILSNNSSLTKTSRLFTDLTENPEKVREFYPLHYKDENSWRTIMDKVHERNTDYSELAQILKQQNTDLCASGKAINNIEKLASGNAFAVVTGQQVGIFTGPLYTIYKAMTAIKLSEYLSEKYQADFIPVFWIESNDHDLEEANHIYLLDSNSDLVKLEYKPSQYTPNCSVKDVLIDDGFLDIINDLLKSSPNTEFKKDIFDIICESYLPSKSLSYGFGQMMSRLFSKYGLVFIDPSDPDVKNLMSPIFQREIESPLKSVGIVNSAGERLRSLGYESQIEKSDDSTCLFIEESGARRKLFFRDGNYEIDGSGMKLSKSQLLETLQIAPWRFSPNVALRPVIQDYILPTVTYVAGPGEASYFAQLNNLYAYMNVSMPIIHPRAGFTIVESKVQRVMEKNGLEISDLSEHYEKLFSRVSKQHVSDKLEQLIESSRSEIESVFEKLSSELIHIDPNIENVTESARKKIDQQINILRERAYQLQRSRDDIIRNQIKRACMNIYPDDKPQERVFNVVQYLVLYGTDLLNEIMTVINPEDIKHFFLFL